jgi:hypothetical protein
MFKFFKKKSPPNYKNEFIKELSPPDPDSLVWTTKEGQKIIVSEMKDSHLQNCHAMLTKRMKVWAAMDIELQRRKLKPKDAVFSVIPNKGCWDTYLEDLDGLSEQDILF